MRDVDLATLDVDLATLDSNRPRGFKSKQEL